MLITNTTTAATTTVNISCGFCLTSLLSGGDSRLGLSPTFGVDAEKYFTCRKSILLLNQQY